MLAKKPFMDMDAFEQHIYYSLNKIHEKFNIRCNEEKTTTLIGLKIRANRMIAFNDLISYRSPPYILLHLNRQGLTYV